jgi:hypothetical protein
MRPECKGLDLSSYLLKPVQRICKYPLLLKVQDHSNAEASIKTRLFTMASVGDIKVYPHLPSRL